MRVHPHWAWTCLGGLLVACVEPGPGGADADAAADGGPRRADAATCRGLEGSSGVGGPCDCQRDCAGGLLCTPEDEAGGPSGSCTRTCDPGGGACGDESLCFEVSSTGMGLCAKACASHEECRDGWACFYGLCAPHCTADDQCRSGTCDRYQSSCAPVGDGESGVLGQCSRAEDCRSAACLAAIGGHCVTFCIPEVGGCPENAHCVGGLDPTDPGVGLCLLRCASSDECPGQLECLNAGDGRRACFVAAS